MSDSQTPARLAAVREAAEIARLGARLEEDANGKDNPDYRFLASAAGLLSTAAAESDTIPVPVLAWIIAFAEAVVEADDQAGRNELFDLAIGRRENSGEPLTSAA